MAGLRRISVSGVRSFGPEASDRQDVRFERPLTLILGDNGCGKSTLLEALLFALCDELPPGSDRGKSFVHHPGLQRSSDVRAQVRLEFSGPDQTPYLVVRSMQVQVRQKKMQFQRLDNLIKTKDAKGNDVEISGRCGDTNNTIANILGVSRAILSNVILCHQEDSNWPLDEGKKLKERFDAIFDATKYNKCFENIKKMRKQYAVDMKLLAQKVEFSSEKMGELDNKKRKLYNDEEKISDVKSKVETLRLKLEPIQSRLSEIDAIEKNLGKFRLKKDMAKERIGNCINQEKEFKKRIKTIYNGTDDELNDKIESFAANLIEKEELLEKTVRNIATVKNKIIDVNKKISTNDMKKSELFTLEGQNQDKINLRNQKLLKVAEFANVPKPSDIEEEDSVNDLLELIKNKHSSQKNDMRKLNERIDEEENTLQEKIDECRDILTRHQEAITSKKNEHKRFTHQANKLQEDIDDAKLSISKLEDVKKQMELADKNFQSVSTEFDTTICEQTINKNDQEIVKLEVERDMLDETLSKMQAQSKKLTEIEMQKDLLNSKQKALSRLKNKNKDAMIKIVGDKIPENNFKRFFQNEMTGVKNEVDELEKQAKKKQNEITVLEANRVHQKNELDRKKNELSKAEEQMYKSCKTLSLEEVLNKLDTDISKLQDQKSEFSSSEFVIKKFINKLDETEPCCPLCHRNFDDKQEVSDLVTELQDKIRNVPKNLESVSQRLSKNVLERDQLISLRPLKTKIDTLKNDEIPALLTKMTNSDQLLEDAQSGLEDYTMALMDPQSKLSIIETLLPDMPLLDQHINEISLITSELTKLESMIKSVDTNLNQEEVNTRYSQIKQEIVQLRSAIKADQLKLTAHNKKINIARDKKNELKEKFLQIQSKVQELYSNQNRYDEIIANKNKLDVEINSLNEKSSKYSVDLKTAQENKTSIVGKLRDQLIDLQKHESELDKKCAVVQNLNREILQHNAKNIPDALNKLKVILNKLNAEIETLNTTLQNETSVITDIKDEISNQSLKKRELEDNLHLRKCQNEHAKLELEIQQLEEKVGELNHASLSKEKNDLINTENDTIVEIARKEGEIKQLQESVELAKRELKQKQYKNVEEEYKSQMCELEILKAADKDIKDYAFAMDCCLMKYHKDKMEKINFIIRDLWRSIYKGNDIDYIEIKTDESTMKSTSTGNRRVYDYRVVQRRNDIEIDMRGSCSSGQKVLACLIIRMALAETFSNRFGVLALDEPTTNLDRENVLGLCVALRDMVMTRMKQNNFMFIIITHDTEFLTSLGSIDKLRHYYKVSRNQEGKSRITRELMR